MHQRPSRLQQGRGAPDLQGVNLGMPTARVKQPMPSDRWAAVLLLASTAILLSACHVPPPVAHLTLQIRATGEFVLDNVPVMPADLAVALAARKVAGADLEIEVRASPEVSISVVRTAIESTQLAHVRVSFAGENGAQ